jgi:iron complex transport system ATP-binding protein
MIAVNNLTCRFGGCVVLDKVTLTLPKSGLTAIIGPNGAGKSTLLRAMSRLLEPHEGTVHVDGLDVHRTGSGVLARRLAILRQDNHLNCRLSVRDLVAFGRYPHSRGRLNPEDESHIGRAIAWLGLEELADRFVDELSGGQRQRAFIAMTLCQDTDYVLLDEPLNNLDIKHCVSMMKMLRKTADETGKTFVMVLHDLNFASCYADHLVALKDGRVVFEGNSDALMQPDVIDGIYGVRPEIHALNGRKIGAYYV